MAAANKILILDDDGNKIGERFEVTDEFVVSVGKNYVEMKDSEWSRDSREQEIARGVYR